LQVQIFKLVIGKGEEITVLGGHASPFGAGIAVSQLLWTPAIYHPLPDGRKRVQEGQDALAP
jgi:hypothetical protein